MRLATIDCGTNTVLMLVADLIPGIGLRAIADELAITRLGEGLDQSGRLSEAAMARTLLAIENHRARARDLGVTHLIAVGTESVRAAQNGAEFLGRVSALGLPLRVISGADEARLSFRAVCRSEKAPKSGPLSVIDIGGGSTELIVGDAQTSILRSAKSVPIGSVRLTERHLRNDPPSAEERAALLATIDAAIAALPPSEGSLWGVAGTVTTLAAMHLGLTHYDGALVEGTGLPVSALVAWTERLATLSVEQRRKITGLDPRRADVIYAGAMILLRLCQRAGAETLWVSDRGVRWGVMEELASELSDLHDLRKGEPS